MCLQRLPIKPVYRGIPTECWTKPKIPRVKIKRILQTYFSWQHHRVWTTSSPRWILTKASSLSHPQPWSFQKHPKILICQPLIQMLTRRCNSGKISNLRVKIDRSLSLKRLAPYWHSYLRSWIRHVSLQWVSQYLHTHRREIQNSSLLWLWLVIPKRLKASVHQKSNHCQMWLRIRIKCQMLAKEKMCRILCRSLESKTSISRGSKALVLSMKQIEFCRVNKNPSRTWTGKLPHRTSLRAKNQISGEVELSMSTAQSTRTILKALYLPL